MLTKEIITANEALSGLSEEQIQGITNLSARDEQTIIGSRIGEVHGMYDTDILASTNIAKNQGEKSYDYMKRAFDEIKRVQPDTAVLNQRIATLESQKLDIEQKGDSVTMQQLNDQRSLTTQLQQQLADRDKTIADQGSDYKQQVTAIKVESEFSTALAQIKIKSEIPDSVKSIIISSAKANILKSSSPDWIESDGVKSLVFRDAKGQIRNNPANGLNPFSCLDLLNGELKDIIDTGVAQKGAGTGASSTNTTVISVTSLSSAKNKKEANEIIHRHLMAEGVASGTKEYLDQSTTLIKEYGIDKLPL